MDPHTDDFDNWTEEFEWVMDQAEKTAENYRTLKISMLLRLEYTPFTRQLQSLSVVFENEDGPMMRVTLDAAQQGYATVTLTVEGTDVLQLRLTQNDYEFRVELAAPNNRGQLSTYMDLHFVKDTAGSYQLSLNAQSGNAVTEFILRGTTSEKDGVLSFTLDTFYTRTTGPQYAEEMVNVGLTVELHRRATVPKLPKDYTNLLAISEEEMDELAKQVGVEPNQVGDKLKDLYWKLSEGIVITG